MIRQRSKLLAACAALAALAAAGSSASAQAEPGVASGFTAGSPYSFRPLDPYWSYRAMPTPPPRYPRLNSPGVFMTSINYPGVYGAYTYGVTPTSYYDISPYFTPDAAPAGFALPAEAVSMQASVLTRNSAHIDVTVPAADSELTFNETPTSRTGLTREFFTPPLLRGGKYVYNVRVTWVDDGVRRTRDKNVFIEAGDRVVVDLSTGSGTFEGPSLRLRPEPEPPASLRPQLVPQKETPR